MKNITQEEWKTSLKKDENAIIIDVRTPLEWNEGVQENALLINIQNSVSFINEIKQMDSAKNYYVYCRSGGRSQMACSILNSLGFKNTFNLLEGMLTWNGKTVNSN